MATSIILCPLQAGEEAILKNSSSLFLVKRIQESYFIFWMLNNLAQGLANFSLWVKTSCHLLFVNKVLLENSHTHSFHIIYGCFCTKREEHSCDRDDMANQIHSYLALSGNFVDPSNLAHSNVTLFLEFCTLNSVSEGFVFIDNYSTKTV